MPSVLKIDIETYSPVDIDCGLDNYKQSAELLLLAQDAVRHYEDSSVEVDRGDLEQIAEALSTLGFYVEQVHFDKPNKDD